MNPLNFLSTEVVAGIIIVGALVMTVRSILMFTGEMAPKVQKLDMMLNKIRDGMAEKKKTVKDLAVIIDPLRAREGKLRLLRADQGNRAHVRTRVGGKGREGRGGEAQAYSAQEDGL